MLEPSHEKQKGRPKSSQSTWTKKGREVVPLMVGNYFPTNPLMLPTCKLWDLIIMGGLKQKSIAKTIFLSIAKTKVH